MDVTFTKLVGGDHSILVVGRRAGPDLRRRPSETAQAIPHDLVHLVVESELSIGDGFWGLIDAGAVFGGFEVADAGVRHRRSGGTKARRAGGAALGAAELLVSGVYRAWQGRDGYRPPVDQAALERACASLNTTRTEWDALHEGASLTRHWTRSRASA